MQYDIRLPADYDMEIIRRRVRERGPAFDALPGLGLKAFAIRRRGHAGSATNEYAPFYIWLEAAPMLEFLCGSAFAGLSDAFGRPPVRHWLGLAWLPGPAYADQPSVAVKAACALDEGAAVAGGAALAQARAGSCEPGIHSTCLALDPVRWELVTFTLGNDGLPPRPGVRYEVVHLARPELERLVESQPRELELLAR